MPPYVPECSESGPGNASFLRGERQPGIVPHESATAEQRGCRQQRQQMDRGSQHLLSRWCIPQ